MNSLKEKEVILKLNKLTKDNLMEWRAVKNRNVQLNSYEMIEGVFYLSEIMGKKIRIYRVKEKYYTNEEDFEWISNYKLEFVDDEMNVLWKFDDHFSINELYKSVSYKTQKIDDIFTKFLKE